MVGHNDAMQLTHRLRLPGPVAEVFEQLSRPELLVACVPGTTAGGTGDADQPAGALAVKLGATPFVFTGTGRYRERDARRHRLVLELRGEDHHRDASAALVVALQLAADGQDTTVEAVTRVDLGGAAARYGTSVVSQAVDRLVEAAAICGGGQLQSASVTATGASEGTLTRLGARLLHRLS
jgi:carbon monoxide dehydrogenase subunit G